MLPKQAERSTATARQEGFGRSQASDAEMPGSADVFVDDGDGGCGCSTNDCSQHERNLCYEGRADGRTAARLGLGGEDAVSAAGEQMMCIAAVQ